MEPLTGETVELLQAVIRNRCVNDATAESGERPIPDARLTPRFTTRLRLDVTRDLLG